MQILTASVPPGQKEGERLGSEPGPGASCPGPATSHAPALRLQPWALLLPAIPRHPRGQLRTVYSKSRAGDQRQSTPHEGLARWLGGRCGPHASPRFPTSRVEHR